MYPSTASTPYSPYAQNVQYAPAPPANPYASASQYPDNMKSYAPGGPAPAYAYGDVEAQYSKQGPSPPNETVIVNGPYSMAPIQAETGWKDVWAAVLFLGSLIATLVFGIVGIVRVRAKDPSLNSGPVAQHLGQYIAILVVILAFAAFSVWYLLYLSQRYAKQMIYVGNLFGAIALFALSGLFFAIGSVASGVIFLIIGLFVCIWLYWVRSRIAFAALCLQYAADLLKKYPSLISAGYGVLLTEFVYIAIFVFAFASVADAGITGLFWPLIFFMYWATNVFENVLHVTVSGTVGAEYFSNSTNKASSPVGASFKRAVTTSFGSICFGSLIVAIIQTIRTLVNSFRRSRNGVLACIAVCILNCIEAIIRFFNMYAFVHVAIYGLGYIQAAKRTFQLISDSGSETIVNYLLIRPAYRSFRIVAAAAGFMIAGMWSRSFANDTLEWVVAGLIGAAITFIAVGVVGAMLWNATVALFVCYAENPNQLNQSNPTLANDLHSKYLELNTNQ